MNELYQRSIEIILENQSASGAYIASPNFPTYHYCWFRDGSFIAYSMDLVGQQESAQRFHQWVAERVNDRRDLVRTGLAKALSGQKLTDAEILHLLSPKLKYLYRHPKPCVFGHADNVVARHANNGLCEGG